MKTLKRGDRCLVLWAKDWEEAVFIKQGTQEGTVVVQIVGDHFPVQISKDSVRPIETKTT